MLASVAGEVTVVAVDHRQAGAHISGQVEGRDAGTESKGRKGVPKIVDPPQPRDTRSLLCRPKVSVSSTRRRSTTALESRRAANPVRPTYVWHWCRELARRTPRHAADVVPVFVEQVAGGCERRVVEIVGIFGLA